MPCGCSGRTIETNLLKRTEPGRGHLSLVIKLQAEAVALGVLACLVLFVIPGALQAEEFSDQAPRRLADYLRVDTTNPPGNENRGVDFIAGILTDAGIQYQTAESAPGRGNIWARLEGGQQLGLVLLHHIDVVPADLEYWSVEPYSGAIQEGFVWGRGALDMKGLGIVQLQAFLALHASGTKLNRDVWYVATADEEAGGFFGAGWLAEHHSEIFEDVGFLLNEGGRGSLLGGQVVFGVEVTQKVPVWLRLVARGRPGHGSSPQVETAVTRLLRAGHRIASTRFPARVVDPVRQMFHGLAPYQPKRLADRYRNIDESVQDADFMLSLQLQDPGRHALLRNTCSATGLSGSSKINVVPPEARLELDCRVLPDQDVDEFIEGIATIVNDPEVEIERVMSFTPAMSSTDTPLYRLIGELASRNYPGSKVVPSVMTGFTDSHFFRDLDIVSYGFAPFVIPAEEGRSVHGNNERISVENMKRGTTFMIELLQAFTTR